MANPRPGQIGTGVSFPCNNRIDQVVRLTKGKRGGRVIDTVTLSRRKLSYFADYPYALSQRHPNRLTLESILALVQSADRIIYQVFCT